MRASCLAVALAAGLHAGAPMASDAQSTNLEVPLPASWVPFTADVVTTSLGTPTTEGKFYRRGDGSTVMVVHTPAQADLITKSGPRPPDPILRLPANRTHQLPEPVEGFVVWEMVTSTSRGLVINHHVPALNGFTIYTDQFGALRQEFTNIQIGEPPADVFLPPER